MPHKQIDGEEWCCQYCPDFKDIDYDIVLHEVMVHHAGCPKQK